MLTHLKTSLGFATYFISDDEYRLNIDFFIGICAELANCINFIALVVYYLDALVVLEKNIEFNLFQTSRTSQRITNASWRDSRRINSYFLQTCTISDDSN